MLKRTKNFNLKDFHTFGMNVTASEFIQIESEQELKDFLSGYSGETPLLVLGGGSNILFSSDFEGIILKLNFNFIEVLSEDDHHVLVEAGAGVEWDFLVEWSVDRSWGGLENLSLIPGSVGACPIQNIGAYGMEVKDTIERVEGVYLKDGSVFSFTNEECRFDYRSSIFKTGLKNQCIITKVLFRLHKKPDFVLNYGNIEDELKQIGPVNLKNIRQAIINVRNSKLPDPKMIGNAGSFFKNPFIRAEKAEKLRIVFPNLPLYPAGEGLQKTSAAFLIDKAGWKGYRRGNAGVHEKQALVLVNYGLATGGEIIQLARDIQSDVFRKFEVELETEVNFI